MAAATEPDRTLLLRCGRIFDSYKQELSGPADVVVSNGAIVSVAPGHSTAADDVFDLRDCTLLPGLLDLDANLIPEPVYADTGLWLYEALSSARDLLRRGFTTARVPGGGHARWGLLDLRRAIAEDLALGCDLMVAAHRIDDQLAADELERGVQREIRNGADWIAVDRRNVLVEQLRGLIARAADTPVAVAAESTAEVRAAVDAGARSSEAACAIDGETAKATANSATYIIPRRGFDFSTSVDVKLCFGGRLPGGLAELAERTGPAGALAAATSTAARCAGLSDRGVIEPGKRADLIAVDGDPLSDMDRLTNVSVVLKRGRLVS